MNDPADFTNEQNAYYEELCENSSLGSKPQYGLLPLIRWMHQVSEEKCVRTCKIRPKRVPLSFRLAAFVEWRARHSERAYNRATRLIGLASAIVIFIIVWS